MFIVLLKFAERKSQAGEFMAAHNQWIKRGFDEGIFLMVGSLQPGIGGVILASGISKDAIHALVADDPFVQEKIVVAEILEIDPKKVDDRLRFLLS